MIENASEVEMCVRYTDQHQGNDILENVKEEIMSVHFSTEIVKRVRRFPFYFKLLFNLLITDF